MSAVRRARTTREVARMFPFYVLMGVLKHVVAVTTLARWAARSPRPRVDADLGARIEAAVARIGQFSPLADRDCLQRSLTLYRHLPRAGVAPRMVMGVRRTGPSVEGHAWIVVDGRAVDGGERHDPPFVEIFAFEPHPAGDSQGR